jgi:hypothetical protein
MTIRDREPGLSVSWFITFGILSYD